MTTTTESDAAPRLAQKQRLNLARFLQVDDKAAPADLDLARQVIAAGRRGDGAAYDKALADAAVGALFRRGVLYFEAPA